MTPIRLNHLAVTVSNLDQSVKFYCDLLGMEQVGSHDLTGETISRMAGKANVHLKVIRLVCPETPDIQIDLQQYLHPTGKISDSKLGDIGNSHFCIEVPNVHASYQALSSQGVRFISPPVEFDLGAEGKVGCVFFLDPDDYVLELVSVFK